MSVHIRYRFLKEKGDYLKDENMTRGYQIFNIWRTPAGEANYRMEEEERLSWQ